MQRSVETETSSTFCWASFGNISCASTVNECFPSVGNSRLNLHSAHSENQSCRFDFWQQNSDHYYWECMRRRSEPLGPLALRHRLSLGLAPRTGPMGPRGGLKAPLRALAHSLRAFPSLARTSHSSPSSQDHASPPSNHIHSRDVHVSKDPKIQAVVANQDWQGTPQPITSIPLVSMSERSKDPKAL